MHIQSKRKFQKLLQSCMYLLFLKVQHKMSGKRDSNPRPSAWEANALPTELLPRFSNAKVTYFFAIAKTSLFLFRVMKQIKKLLTSLCLIKSTRKGRSYSHTIIFLHTTHLYTHVLCFYNHHHT